MAIDEVRNNLLTELLAELLIMEAYFTKITGEKITEEDTK